MSYANCLSWFMFNQDTLAGIFKDINADLDIV